MHSLSLYNTLTRGKAPFTPHDPNRVTLYVCGPTVYDFAHIGNARPVVVFDTLYRLLQRLYMSRAAFIFSSTFWRSLYNCSYDQHCLNCTRMVNTIG